MTRPEFRFELVAEGGVRYWRVLSGRILLAELFGPAGAGCFWRLRAVGSETPAEACWPADPGPGRRYRLPERVERRAISQIAAWALDSLAEAAQANALLRRRLQDSTEWLESHAGLLRASCANEDGDWDSDADLNVYELVRSAIAANRAALARVKTKGESA